MNRAEAAQLLTMAAAYDARTIGEADVIAWHAVLQDVDFADAQTALVDHFRISTYRLMPAHICQGVKAMRAERLRGVDILDLGSDVDPDDVETYIATVRRRRDDIAAGRLTPAAAFGEIEANYRRRAITTGGRP